MATTTSRLGLTKPATTDPVDIAQLNANADKLDAAVGIFVCTSATRPSTPWNGLTIYETDTKDTLVYNNAAWVIINDYDALTTLVSRLGVKINVQSAQPSTATLNDLWFWGS